MGLATSRVRRNSAWFVCGRKHVHYVRNEKDVVAGREGVGKEISLQNGHAIRRRGAAEFFSSDGRRRRKLKKRALQMRIELRNR